MPIHEFKCPKGHVFEKVFFTFDSVKDELPCEKCRATAKKLDFSTPAPGHFYGEGFHKPSPTKRHSYKKAHKDGNEMSGG